VIDRTRYASAAGVARGAYVLAEADNGPPEVLLLATGSEVALCLEARERLQADGIQARVVSMPSWECSNITVANTPGIARSVAGAR
jgi:transketolase